ncbi:FitA-like ribbon-helix-helix domain-containing protein [Streptomonospora litoralis]|uniref:Antitoxin FitA-like ribbon-helix-helix domain-containing protein n=1 Tax=Streptomonospora litoralis TaxID=2498135 RepID=A0A4V0ZJZ0_9ACTN|nr:hypothetical protein [Streptomonospora litoralis]QBI55152.1 hypothetical protein EKD16_16915 [Streptomonospora litoralis]
MGETNVVQIRGVPAEAVETLKARAAERGQSLAAYLRDLIIEEASLPDPAETMARLSEDEPIAYTIEDLRDFTADGRR